MQQAIILDVYLDELVVLNVLYALGALCASVIFIVDCFPKGRKVW